MNSLNKIFRELDISRPDALPCFQKAKQLLIGSDYSGQHSTSQFEALAFVIADAGRLAPWLVAQQQIRRDFLPDGRRISYKTIRDKQKARALPAILSASDQIQGLLLVMLVDKRIGMLFHSGVDDARSNHGLFLNWPTHVIEKLLRVCHTLALVVAGLSSNRQDILWITDQDEIAANEARHYELVQAFGRIASHYLEHDLGHLRIATTASDSGNRDVEDFVAIADLAAGSICEAINSCRGSDVFPAQGVLVPPPANVSEKAMHLLNWFSNDQCNLRRIVVSLEPADNPTKLRVRHYQFHGSTFAVRPG